MIFSLAAAGAGWGMAWKFYRHADKGYSEPIASAAPVAYDLLMNKYYVDEGYDYAFTGRKEIGDLRLGAIGLGEAASLFDSRIVDGAVNGAGFVTRVTAKVSSWWDKWIVDLFGERAGVHVASHLLGGQRIPVGICAVVRAGDGDWPGRICFSIT